MKHLISGEYKLFNIQKDYGEENNLAAQMPEKVASMEAMRQQYVDEVDGGEIEVVYDALYNLMDEFGRRARVEYERKLAELVEENPADMVARKAVLLAEMNDKLKRNAISKEKSRLYSESDVWKEYPYAQDAKRNIEATWVDVIE